MTMSPRLKEFDPDQALDAAMQLFWQKGFEATSMQDLVDQMGINRYSLYDTFGDKHQLFIQCCEKYQANMETMKVELFDQADSGLQAIQNFFNIIAQRITTKEGCCGCLMTNAAVEKALDDEIIAECTRKAFEGMEKTFHKALQRAQKEGEISQDKNTKDLASYLVCLLQGITVMGKTFPQCKRIQKTIDCAMDLLK